MTKSLSLGLPRMHVEFGERRDFLPNFIARLEKYGANIFLEYGYGSGMGLNEDDYRHAAPNVKFISHEEAYHQDAVLVLRCPLDSELQLLSPGATLLSMLHYPTRPERVEFLRSLNIEGISLDSLTDDVGRRLVENLRAVAWNGLETGFQILQRTYPAPGIGSPDRNPIRATILGVGAVGIQAVQAASRYGDARLWKSLAKRGVPGILVTAVDYDLTGHKEAMREILSQTDILVDATQRPDPSKVVIPNEWIAWLPEHAVLVDLSVDPYDFSVEPPIVKGIEGIPQGNLDQFVFMPDDPIYERLPKNARHVHRRPTASCYSWPGIHPKDCMDLYGSQLRPIMRTLIEKGIPQKGSGRGSFFERAIQRAMLSNWEN